VGPVPSLCKEILIQFGGASPPGVPAVVTALGITRITDFSFRAWSGHTDQSWQQSRQSKLNLNSSPQLNYYRKIK
jgi:hypothetical protein